MREANSEDYFEIGAIVNVHGLRGEIKVLPITDDPGRFELLEQVEVYDKDVKKVYELEKARIHKAMVMLKLKGVNDRTAAEQLVGGVIKVPRSMAIPLEEDEYYQKDLLDLTVVTDTGNELGLLVQIIETGANDVYVVRPSKNEGKDILIPAIKECILSVDLPENKMTVHLMKGLREL